MTTATSRPNPLVTSYNFEVLACDEDYAKGECIAWYEDFGDSVVYAAALNAQTGNFERGGPMPPERAKAWAERVAGLHPTKPGDARPPFYYEATA